MHLHGYMFTFIVLRYDTVIIYNARNALEIISLSVIETIVRKSCEKKSFKKLKIVEKWGFKICLNFSNFTAQIAFFLIN